MQNLIHIDDFALDKIEDIVNRTNQLLKNNLSNTRKYSDKIAVIIFFESSTRTFLSFETALKRLKIKTINLQIQHSAFNKGESLLNFFKNVAAMNPNLLIVRHPSSTVFELIKNVIKCPIINAGSGASAHPTQALLDIFTMLFKENLNDKKIAIVGDIANSRVASSNVVLLQKMGAKITLIGPKNFLPQNIDKNIQKSAFFTPELLAEQDIIMMLRIQFERIIQKPISKNEYYKNYALKAEHLTFLKSDCLILHPGPVNVSVEIDDEVMDDARSKILQQVEFGVAVRMAVIEKLINIK